MSDTKLILFKGTFSYMYILGSKSGVTTLLAHSQGSSKEEMSIFK